MKKRTQAQPAQVVRIDPIVNQTLVVAGIAQVLKFDAARQVRGLRAMLAPSERAQLVQSLAIEVAALHLMTQDTGEDTPLRARSG
ncbi:MAG: hypothetical protein HC911_15870 [Chloroflexaceae bacterium]|nr:hypothetical protein [Chloroflexaceae bacterium]